MLKTFIHLIKLIWNNSTRIRYKIILSVINAVLMWFSLFLSVYYLWVFVDTLTISINKSKEFLFFWLLYWLMSFIYRRFFERLDYDIQYNVLYSYFFKLFNQPYLWHVHNSTWYIASIIRKITINLESFNHYIINRIIPYLSSLLLFIFYSFSVTWELSIYFLIFNLFLIWLMRLSYNKRIIFIREKTLSLAKFEKVYYDFLYNVKTIKRLNILNFWENKIKHRKDTLNKPIENLFKYNSYQWLIIDFWILIMFLLPIMYYFFQFTNHWTWIWTIIIIYNSMHIFREFNKNYLNLLLKIAYLKADVDILESKVDLKSNIWKKWKNIKQWRRIEFNNTSYIHHKNHSTFKHSINNLKFIKWEKIWIIGKSWAWKSTFLNLLTNNLIPQVGSIKINWIDYENIDKNFFKKHITYVSQDVELFDLTLHENICMWKKIKETDLKKLLHWLWLNDLLTKLKWNLHIKIWEKWIKISTWERQRINIARWLLLNRDILVFDEITANLDIKTAKRVWKYIFDNYKDNTIIASSHCKEMLKHVDRVIEFKDGEIIKK